ncbi:hypothetical protein O1611_g10406 [Lasiodiplodia mahajangana]|uniref:Uncharacterized protein n=1 Tax=Lasiodiplodia mahajangana TaxID=1108764 RepID=A0ACC2IYX3_9PEZI|nr:hypothetical protein O1611_g10406 [Lasiodiplodia mahajangana]
MEQAMRRHFFYHVEEARDLDAEKQRCHWCQIRTFTTHERYPITIVNNEDDTMIDPNFRFMDRSIRANDIEPTRKEFLTGCECDEDTDCRWNTCTCLQDVEDGSSDDDDDEDDDEDEDDDLPSEPDPEPHENSRIMLMAHNRKLKKAYAYHSRGARAGYLRSKVLTSRDPIYECHEKSSARKTEAGGSAARWTSRRASS